MGATVSLGSPLQSRQQFSLYLHPGPFWLQASSSKKFWEAVQKPVQEQHRPWSFPLIFGVLTPTPACSAPAVTWVMASAEWVQVADPMQSHTRVWNMVGIRRSLVPDPDASPWPGARSPSRVGGVSPPFFSFPSSSYSSLRSFFAG